MTTNPLLRALRASAPWLNDEAARIMVDSVARAVATTLLSGETVQFTGLGKFQLFHALARKGRNPRNPEIEIVIPAKKRVKFTPAPGLVAALEV